MEVERSAVRDDVGEVGGWQIIGNTRWAIPTFGVGVSSGVKAHDIFEVSKKSIVHEHLSIGHIPEGWHAKGAAKLFDRDRAWDVARQGGLASLWTAQTQIKEGRVGVTGDGGVSWNPRGVMGKVGKEVVAWYLGVGVHQMTRCTVAFVWTHKERHAVLLVGGELCFALYKAIVFGVEGVQKGTSFKGGDGFSNFFIGQGGVVENTLTIEGFELIGIGRLGDLCNHLCAAGVVHFNGGQEGFQGLLL